MDNKNKTDIKKPTVFKQPPKAAKQQSYNIQPTYYNPENKYENAIPTHMELYTLFLTENFETIKKEIYNNINLKINTVNGNLINAIIENESMEESNKIYLLKELINNRNIDVNVKNKFDQLPLHVACKKEYYEIIKLLITKSDKTELDVFGNAPIHYLTKFIIMDCGPNSYYNANNASLKSYKPSLDDFKFFKILLHGIKTIISSSVKEKKYIEDLITFISLNKFFNVEEFEKIIRNNIKKIKDIKQEYKESNNNLKIETILNETSSEFMKLYKNFKIENIYTEEEILKNIQSLKQKSENDIIKHKINIEGNLDSILENAEQIKKIFFDNTVSTVFVLKYVYETLWSTCVEDSRINIEDYLEKCKGYIEDDYSSEKLQMLIKIICIIKKYIDNGDPIIQAPFNYVSKNDITGLLDFSINKFNPSNHTFKNTTSITDTSGKIDNTSDNGVSNEEYINEWIHFLILLKNNSDNKYKNIYNNIKYDIIFLMFVEFPNEKFSFIKDMNIEKQNIINILNYFNDSNNVVFCDKDITSKDIYNTYETGENDKDSEKYKKNKLKFLKNNGYYIIKNTKPNKEYHIKLDNENLIQNKDFYYYNSIDIEYNKNLFIDAKNNYILIGDCLINKSNNDNNNNLVDEEYYDIDFSNFKFGNVYTFFKDIDKYIEDIKKKINAESIIFCTYDCINILDESLIIFDKMIKLYDDIKNKKNDILNIKKKFEIFKNNIVSKYHKHDEYDKILKTQINYIDEIIKEYINIDTLFNNLYKQIIDLLTKINKLIIEYNKENSINYTEQIYYKKNTISNFAINKFKPIIDDMFPKNFDDFKILYKSNKNETLFYLDVENYNELYLDNEIIIKKNNLIKQKLLPDITDFLTIFTDDNKLLTVLKYNYTSGNDAINKFINILKNHIINTTNNKDIEKLFKIKDIFSSNKIFLPILFKFIPLLSYCLYKKQTDIDKKKNKIGLLQTSYINLMEYFQSKEFISILIYINLELQKKNIQDYIINNIIEKTIKLLNVEKPNIINIDIFKESLQISEKSLIVLELYNKLQIIIKEKSNYNVITDITTKINIIENSINSIIDNYDKLSESIKCFSLPSDFVNEIKDILNTDDYQFLKNFKIVSVMDNDIFKKIDNLQNFSIKINLNKKSNDDTKIESDYILKKNNITKFKYQNKNEKTLDNYLYMFISNYLIKIIDDLLFLLKDIIFENNGYDFYKDLSYNEKIMFIKKYFLILNIKITDISGEDNKKNFTLLYTYIKILNNDIDSSEINIFLQSKKTPDLTLTDDDDIINNGFLLMSKEIKKTINDIINKYNKNIRIIIVKNYKLISKINEIQDEINDSIENGIDISGLLITPNNNYNTGFISTLYTPTDLKIKKNKNIIYSDFTDSPIGNYIIKLEEYENTLTPVSIQKPIASNPIISLYNIENIISIIVDKLYTFISESDHALLKKYFDDEIKKEFKSIYIEYKDFITKENVVKTGLKNYLNTEIISRILIENLDIKDKLSKSLTVTTVGGNPQYTTDIQEKIKNEMQKIIEKNAFGLGHVTKIKINKALGNKLFNDKCYNNNVLSWSVVLD